MKIIRFSHSGSVSYGELTGDTVVRLSGDIGNLAADPDASSLALSEVELLAPTTPSKIVAIGPGYKIYTQGGPAPERPYYWLKGPNTVQNPDGKIILPSGLTVNHEAEIAIVIGKRARNVSVQDAPDHIL